MSARGHVVVVLDRKPKPGETYVRPDLSKKLHVYEALTPLDGYNDERRACVLMPLEEFAADAAERIKTLLRHAWFIDVKAEVLSAAILPPEPKPETPEWIMKALNKWRASPGGSADLEERLTEAYFKHMKVEE